MRHVSFFGHFGSLNTGNESTLLAILSRLREASPECEFRCICTDPEAATARYGIDAVAISDRGPSGFRAGDLSLAQRIRLGLRAAGAELGQYARALRTLEGTDMLVVPGTGLINDAFGLGGWGPYSLFKWVLAAKLRRVPVRFVSVGAGPVTSTAGRLLVRAALAMADYRSYRDEASRDHLRSIGCRVSGDPVYPDLVFGLPEPLLPGDAARAHGTRRVVGLGLMLYEGRYSATGPRPQTYSAYLESLATFAGWLLAHGYDIRLLVGDGEGDPIVVEDFTAVLREQTAGFDERRVVARPIAGFEDVLAELAATDVVVATRFHNVLLALLMRRPVIAISFHHKCSSLMRRMGLSDYCHEIHDMAVDRLIAQFEDLECNRAAVTRAIGDGVEAARAAVDEQYGRILAAGGGAPTRVASSLRARRRRAQTALLGSAERAWHLLPTRVRDRGPVRACGASLHTQVCRHADREMYVGTSFLRNRPALELMGRLVEETEPGSRVRIAVLGCSIGVEVYSILWTLRSRRPDLELVVSAVDISPGVLRVAERGVYDAHASEFVNWPIFEGLSDAERERMFDWDGDAGRVKPWLQAGVTWQLGDASDPELVARLGTQDLVVANNFLCHMEPRSAQRCLRNLARLVSPGGHLFVSGVDLDLRTQVALELGWEPIAELRAEIHDGDAAVRYDWPWRWWGLEPLDPRRPDWETRYTAFFQVPAAA